MDATIRIHLNEEIQIHKTDIKVKFIFFDVYYAGKATEELGDKFDLKFIFKNITEEKKVNLEWYERLSFELKVFEIFDYKIQIINNSYDFLEKEDEKGAWIEFVIEKV